MKNKIQYVRVLDYDKGDWYEELAISKAIIEVTESQISKIDYACVHDYMHRLIRKVHCEPVQIKELDKDIDGEYLEINGISLKVGYKTKDNMILKYGNYEPTIGSTFKSLKCVVDHAIISFYKKRNDELLLLSESVIDHLNRCYLSIAYGWYFEDEDGRQYGLNSRNIDLFEIPKEEKKVDLIAEVEILNNYIIKYEREYIELGVPNVTNDFAKDTVLAFKAIKQHMEDKKG